MIIGSDILKVDSPQDRFDTLNLRYAGLSDIQSATEKMKDTGLSEPALQQVSGWSKSKVREALCILESFGFVEVEHGKSTLIVKKFNEPVPGEEALIDIFKRHINLDTEAAKLVRFINANYSVGDKLLGERTMKKTVQPQIQIGREKLREVLLRLECTGFLKRMKQKKRVLLKSLDHIL